jgi:hypothetical protein
MLYERTYMYIILCEYIGIILFYSMYMYIRTHIHNSSICFDSENANVCRKPLLAQG